MTITHLSYSALETWQDCGEKFRLSRVEKVGEVPAWALVGGSAVHSVTEVWDLRDFGIENGEPDTFEAAFEAEIAKREEESGVPQSEWGVSGRASKEWPNKEDKSWWLAHGQAMVERWRSWLERSPWQIWIDPDKGLPAVELSFEVEIGGVAVRGHIDRILEPVLPWDQPTLAVVDLKAGRNEPKDTRQLQVYSEAMLPTEVKYGAYFMVRDGKLVGPYDLDVVRDGRTAYEYAQAMDGIRAGLFPVRKDRHCDWCRVKDFCYAAGGERAHEVLPFRGTKVTMGPQEGK